MFYLSKVRPCGRECPNNKVTDGSVKYLEPELQNGGSKYRKLVKIGNAGNFDANVDAASSDCLIKASCVLDNNFLFVRAPCKLIGFGNEEIKSSCVIEESLIVDECIAEKIRFRVVPDDVQPFEVIIGRNFTELPNVSYFKVDESLVFRSRENFPFEVNPVAETTNLRMEKPDVLKTMQLPGASINFVRVTVAQDELYLPIENTTDKPLIVEKDKPLENVVFSVSASLSLAKPRLNPITEDDVHVGTQLGKEEKDSLLKLLNKYRECSAMSDHELGCTKLIEMEIHETPGSEPVFSKPYKASATQRKTMRNIVREWKESGLVSDTSSAYASPCLLVPRANGPDRLVCALPQVEQKHGKNELPLTEC